MSQILSMDPDVKFLGEKEYTKFLGSKKAPMDCNPNVILLSHALLTDVKFILLSELYARFPGVKIMVHGYNADFRAIAEVLSAGAKGYFVLTSGPDKLLKACRIVREGSIWGPSEAVALMMENAKQRRGLAFLDAGEVIPVNELTILELLKQGMTNKEIANNLGVAEITIKYHLTKLYKRFHVNTRLQLLAYAMANHLISNRDLELHLPR